MQYDWDAENVAHLGLHKIRPSEAEEVLEDAPIVAQVQHHAAEERFLVLGHTKSGRLLALVYTEREKQGTCGHRIPHDQTPAGDLFPGAGNMSKVSRMPRFKSEADEAAWWDRNPDFFADCFDKAAKKGEILRGVPKIGTLIRIPAKDARAARKLAAHNRLPYQTYVQKLLRQALEKERLAG